MPHSVEVTARFDEEAGVWFTEACSVPGLVTEATTLDGLLQKVARMTADLAEDDDLQSIPVQLLAQREASIAH